MTPAIRRALMDQGLDFFLPCMPKKQWNAFSYTKGIESDDEARKAWSWLHKNNLGKAACQFSEEYGP